MGSELGLGEEVGGGGVGLEEADAVLLVEEEVEVAGSIGFDGVELGWIGGWTGRGAEAGEDELLGVLGVECDGDESAETGEEESESERWLRHYEFGCGDCAGCNLPLTIKF